MCIFFSPRWQVLHHLKNGSGDCRRNICFCGIRISWMCPLHYKCWKAGSLEEKGGNRRILLYIKPPFEFTETKMISPIHYISPRTNKMKYWPTISWQVNPTAAGRIMTLIVSWRANRCVDVYLVFNLKLEFVSGYLTYCSIITLFFQSSPL